MPTESQKLISAARELSTTVGRLRFSPPVSHVYNPLAYAWEGHAEYLRRFGNGPKRVVFLGMNPGPFGMVQTGVPFGEVAAVRDWMGIQAKIARPQSEHPKRPVLGFDCRRSEVSGKRLWGLFAARFGRREQFFKDHLVMNYCPLAFCSESGGNLTPDKLARQEREKLLKICDDHLCQVLDIVEPQWLIGIGAFAVDRGSSFCEARQIKLGGMLHPSPASPAANKDWPGVVSAQLRELGVWS